MNMRPRLHAIHSAKKNLYDEVRVASKASFSSVLGLAVKERPCGGGAHASAGGSLSVCFP